MPRVKMSEKCLECLETNTFFDAMCPAHCPEGQKIAVLWGVCWKKCKNDSAECELDPRSCGKEVL
jgi:hypothetical protein